MKTRLFILTALVMMVSVGISIAGETPTVDDIVNKTNLAAYYAGDDGKSDVTMTITDSQGRTRSREFAILRRDVEDGGAQKFYVYFKKPSDVRRMVFMVHKYIDKDDDRWLYLPALDLVKRIAASDKRTSFVGSHFFYEDVSGRAISEDTHELVETTEKYYVLKNTPKDPDSVEFQSFTMYIDKKTFIPMKIEYLNKQGEKYRIIESLEVKDIQGIPTVTKQKVQDLMLGGNTVSEFTNIEYNIGLSDDIFTERYLRRAPREAR